MKLIGHRGAAGIAQENSLAGIRVARNVGVDAIEIDTRLTADGHFVLSHDDATDRVTDENLVISEVTTKVLHKVVLHNGEPLPSLDDALKEVGDTPLFIDVKGFDWGKPLAKKLVNSSKKNITIIGRNRVELATFKRLTPNTPTYLLQVINPFEALQAAKKDGFTGIAVNFWSMNLALYMKAKRANIKIAVYTINTPLLARLFRNLYPEIAIITNIPHSMQFLRVPQKKRLTKLTGSRSKKT